MSKPLKKILFFITFPIVALAIGTLNPMLDLYSEIFPLIINPIEFFFLIIIISGSFLWLWYLVSTLAELLHQIRKKLTTKKPLQ